MGAIPNPAPPLPKDPEPDAKGDTSFLLWLAKSGPAWARIPAIIVGILIAVVPTILLLSSFMSGARAKVADDSVAKELQMAADTDATGRQSRLDLIGQKIKDNLNLTAEEQAFMGSTIPELNHELAHLTSPVDNVKWVTFAVEDKKDYFGYKLFPSDRCLLIARIEHGFAKVQWLRDPNSAKAPDVPKASGAAAYYQVRPFETEHLQSVAAVLPDRDLSSAAQSAIEGLADEDEVMPVTPNQSNALHSQQVQAGCLNPHPWQFQQFWGGAINQCQQPMYRRWADGCTQVQIFDHCQNFWGPIVWQFCAASHHP